MLNIYYFLYAFICTAVLVFTKPRSESLQAGSISSGSISRENLKRISQPVPNQAYYLTVFKKFKAGHFLLSWNWGAFFFTTVWQVYRGLWVKAFLYLTLISFVGFWIFISHVPFLRAIFWISIPIFYGLFSNYDFYLLKVYGEHLWLWFEYKKHKKSVWAISSIFFVFTLVSNIWFYRSSYTPWSHPYKVNLLPIGQLGHFEIVLKQNKRFEIFLPTEWKIDRLRSKERWIVIEVPGIEELGLGIYDLPEELQKQFDETQIGLFIQHKIFGKSLASRWIFDPSKWDCSPRKVFGWHQWSFCGYSGTLTGRDSYHVVFSVFEKYLVLITYPEPTQAALEAFHKSLEIFLSSLRSKNGEQYKENKKKSDIKIYKSNPARTQARAKRSSKT